MQEDNYINPEKSSVKTANNLRNFRYIPTIKAGVSGIFRNFGDSLIFTFFLACLIVGFGLLFYGPLALFSLIGKLPFKGTGGGPADRLFLILMLLLFVSICVPFFHSLIYCGMELIRGRYRVRNHFKAYTRIIRIGGASLLTLLVYVLPIALVGLLITQVASVLKGSEVIYLDLLGTVEESGLLFEIVKFLYFVFVLLYYLNMRARLTLVIPLILDRKYGVFAAFGASFKCTGKFAFHLTLFHFLLEFLSSFVFVCFLPLSYGARFAMESAAVLYMMGEIDEDGKIRS